MLKCEITLSEEEKQRRSDLRQCAGKLRGLQRDAASSSAGDVFQRRVFNWLYQKFNIEFFAFGWRPSGEAERIQIRMGQTEDVAGMINSTRA